MDTGLVEAMYPYEFISGNGDRTTMGPGDRFALIKKSNSDWWYVRRQGDMKPIYLPATYLKEIHNQSSMNAVFRTGDAIEHLGDGKSNRSEQSVESPFRRKMSDGSVNYSRSRQSFGSKGVDDVVNRLQNELTIPEADYNGKDNQYIKRPNQLNFNTDENRPQGPRFGDLSPQSGSKDRHWGPTTPSPDSDHSQRRQDDLSAGWDTLKDDHGRQYYYNRQTQETTWNPPNTGHGDTTKTGDLPAGWREELGSSGEVHSFVHERDANCRWFSSTDQSGKTYYYNEAGDTCWELPDDPRVVRRKDRYDGHQFVERRSRTMDMRPHSMFVDRPGQRGLSGGFTPNIAVDSRLVMEIDGYVRSPSSELPPAVISSPILPPPVLCSPTDQHHMMFISHTSSPSSPHSFSPPPSSLNVQRRYSESHAFEDISPETIPREKEGVLSRMKLLEGGRKVKQKWCPYYTVLTGSSLRFYKDIKVMERGGSPPSSPDATFDMYGAELKWPKGERSKLGRKFAFELHSNDGMELLLQGETEHDCLEWFEVLNHNVRALGPHPSRYSLRKPGLSEDIPEHHEVSSPKSLTRERHGSSSVPNVESGVVREERKKNIKDILKSFINKRPNPEVLKKKGILKEENVFGKRLDHLCEKEKGSVPRFVMDCIFAIDQRGLEVDGIYRVSGNLSMIQRLRFQVDQEKPIDLNSPPWKNDIHVIAGALKLFFRELPEPLFTFRAFDNFISAVGILDAKPRNKKIREVIKSLPHCNQDTIKYLFGHLFRVISLGDKNRMKAQNVAIVFGPTLMWSKDESFSMATNLAYQNRLMELMLSDYEQIFISK